MNKILITGFRHSGTTMMVELLRNHPQVGWIEMEEGFVELYDKPKSWLILMAMKRVRLSKQVWGDKIPYGTRRYEKDAERVIKFSRRWLKVFGKKGRILNIIRHPLDTILSGSDREEIFKKPLKLAIKSVPEYIDYTNGDERIATVVYEDLVTNPKKHLHNIFNFCGLMSTEKILESVANTSVGMKFGKINADRAFAFKKQGIKSDIDYNALIERVKRRL